jgi:hypothetical protein
MGGAATFDGRRFINKHYNQPKVGVGGGGVIVMICEQDGTCGGDFFLSFGVANGAKQKS